MIKHGSTCPGSPSSTLRINSWRKRPVRVQTTQKQRLLLQTAYFRKQVATFVRDERKLHFAILSLLDISQERLMAVNFRAVSTCDTATQHNYTAAHSPPAADMHRTRVLRDTNSRYSFATIPNS